MPLRRLVYRGGAERVPLPRPPGRAGVGWGSAELIESDNGNVYYLQVAMDAAGNAVAVWSQSDGTRRNIWANVFE